MTTGEGIAGGAAALVGADGTTLGPEGSNESSPRPNALRFSTGLCSSIAAIGAPLKYIVSRYIFVIRPWSPVVG